MISITQKEFRLIAEFIEKNYGIHLKDAKKVLLITRLNNVISDLGFKNFTEYYNYLINDKSGSAITTFVNKITTNHTFFMRESDHFYYFKNKVLPEITPKINNHDLRVWCAASSTGEEPYTLAMLIDEYFGEEKKNWDTKILATDISTKVLETAKKGIYSNEAIEPLERIWQLNYFQKIDSDKYKVIDRIQNDVIYRKFNLMEPIFPFKKKFDVIFCRNVMIYFDIKTKEKLVQKLYNSLNDNGYLFIGHSESLNPRTTNFKHINPSIYKK